VVVDGQAYEVPIEHSEVTIGLVILPLVTVQDTDATFRKQSGNKSQTYHIDRGIHPVGGLPVSSAWAERCVI
jgi:hypothetical protein